MSGITILNPANVPMGPFTRAEVAAKLERGEVTLGSLAHVEGLTQWTPLRDVLARVDAANPPPPAPVSGALPTPPASLATTSPTYSYAATMQPPSHLVYAGFWVRFAAYLIDALFLSAAAMLVALVVFLPFSFYLAHEKAMNRDITTAPSAGFILLVLCLEILFYGAVFVGAWLYFALLESGRWQGTIGKRLLGLRVTGMDGQRIGFGRATGRYFGKILSGLILNIGYIMAGFTERKQALHDMIANTLVVRD